MSFLQNLKKIFTYTGEEDTEEDVSVEGIGNKEEKKFRIDISNPLSKAKDLKNSTMEAVKNNKNNRRRTISNRTKDLMYTFYHISIEKDVNKGKPLEEAKLLYKRFLEDKITEESMYSDLDLEYIKALVSMLKGNNKTFSEENVDLKEVCKMITESKYFLNIVELLDIQHGYKFMDYACERSYVVCDYVYHDKVNLVDDLIKSLNNTCFKLDVEHISFVLLNEVKSLIYNESSEEQKKKYVLSKITPFFNRYVDESQISITLLYRLYSLFYIIENQASINNKVEETIDDKQVEEKVFEVISNEIDSVQKLKNNSQFINLYKPLADSRNPDVTIEELEEAVNSIRGMAISGDYELSQEEFKIFKDIELRLRQMIDSNLGGV